MESVCRGNSTVGSNPTLSASFDFDNLPDTSSVRDLEIIEIDDALDVLEHMDSRKARVIELRFFGGLSVEETAAALNVSPQTVMRDWKLARAWMMRETPEKLNVRRVEVNGEGRSRQCPHSGGGDRTRSACRRA